MKRIYLDYAAATPLDPRVEKAMQPFWQGAYANASALHSEARDAREAIDNARRGIAGFIGAAADEVIFTSGGTESNNLAIFGGTRASWAERPHVVTSGIEHPSVLDVFRELALRGVEVSYVGVDQEGILDLKKLERVVREDTSLVSIMYINNEVGTIQPLKEVRKILNTQKSRALFHSDASQAPLFVEMDVDDLGVDLLTLDAQKMYGPKGVGALYKREKAKLEPFMLGGKQEFGLRPGTHNTPGIVGMHAAYEIAEKEREELARNIRKLRDYFVAKLHENVPDALINGHLESRLPNNINISLPGMEGEFVVLQLDAAGIACSSKSACFGKDGEGSPVVAQMDESRAQSAVRFSLGKETTKDDIDKTIQALSDVTAG